MTPFNVCPACVRLNLPDASICTTCGTMLRGTLPPAAEEHSETFVDLTEMELDADTTPSVHLDAPELQRWFNSRTGGLDGLADMHHPAKAREPETPLPPLLLREFEAPAAPSDDDAAPANSLPPGVILADPQAPLPYVPPERRPASPSPRRSAASSTAPKILSPVAKAATKALRRAQVRRNLLANKGEPVAAAAPPDVLVLDSDDGSREQLCALLEAFGFRTHPVQSTMQAVRMLAAKRYAVAFLNIIFDGSAAPAAHDLCSRVKAPPIHASDTECALIVVTGSARPVERVRAELAGCDAFLLKPVSRGAVAQALEACGVALPIDSRRV
jgi:CheY-like chemotaxis protein